MVAKTASIRYASAMKIWITRHGQTNLNKQQLMQGRMDEPLNETGIAQAHKVREMIGDIKFDAVYSSPLCRAIKTATIVGNVPEEEVIIDERIIEAGFGKYEGKPYGGLGPWMTVYWMYPEFFPAPKTVETLQSMIDRSHDFLRELEQKDYENVLVTCHGGIIRPLSGYLADRKSGVIWRPKPKNCEMRVYESVNGVHKHITTYYADTSKQRV